MTEFTYKWKLTDLEDVPKNGLKVFSCFACGGGSTMGYKMSGFDVIGCNEIDPEMMATYRKNHDPKYHYLEDIRTFKNRSDLPKELYELDILDGSPPCSSFSMAGSREKGWGKKKKFREGQADQTLDDLFFDFIELVHKLQPKVVVAENVKGILQGNAKGYVKQIVSLFNTAGYGVQLFLLNGASMGLPQKRERVFFVCKRKDLDFPKLTMRFNERQVSVKEAFGSIADINYPGRDQRGTSIEMVKYYDQCKPGESLAKYHPKGHAFGHSVLPENTPCGTLTAAPMQFWHYESPRRLSGPECCVLGSFPVDYKFESDNGAKYLVGMSVPPLMMRKVSREIHKQWFNNGR